MLCNSSEFISFANENTFKILSSTFDFPLKFSVEIKSTEEVRSANIRNLRTFADEYPGSRRILVSLDRFSRNIGEVECLYVYDFFHMLWSEGL